MAPKGSRSSGAAPPPAKAAAPGPGKTSPQPAEPAGGEAAEEGIMDDYDMPVIIKVKPEDQLLLSPEELEKEVPPRVLYPANPRAPHNLTQYSFKDKMFKRDDQVD